jgi:hypothetical protein
MTGVLCPDCGAQIDLARLCDACGHGFTVEQYLASAQRNPPTSWTARLDVHVLRTRSGERMPLFELLWLGRSVGPLTWWFVLGFWLLTGGRREAPQDLAREWRDQRIKAECVAFEKELRL